MRTFKAVWWCYQLSLDRSTEGNEEAIEIFFLLSQFLLSSPPIIDITCYLGIPDNLDTPLLLDCFHQNRTPSNDLQWDSNIQDLADCN